MRTYSADRANEVINDPSVRPYVGPEEMGELDLTPLLDDPMNWCMMGEHGGFLLTWSSPHAHEVHTFILPEGRGAWAREAARDGLVYARENGDKMLWTKIADQPHVALYAKAMGMEPTGETVVTFGKPYAIYSMELDHCL